ncbi:RNA-directed DNA polymerase [Malassezia sp. CBS 17886]|nr:RNA-directed DNA polymerase [Malassezia sp. CBS 17886]
MNAAGASNRTNAPDAPMRGAVYRHVLPQYYHGVEHLHEYLARWLPADDYARVTAPTPGCGGAWARLMDGIVGLHADAGSSRDDATKPLWMVHMLEEGDAASPQALVTVLRHVQLAAFAQRRADVLTLGYRRNDGNGAGPTSLSFPGETCLLSTHPNTVLSAILLGGEWHLLFQRLGPCAFYRLLLDTSYYAPIPDSLGCYAQMWGVPLMDVRKRVCGVDGARSGKRAGAAVAGGASAEHDARARKRRRRARRGSQAPRSDAPQDGAPPRRPPAPTHAYLPRARLFYARAVNRYRYGIVLGLPDSRDVLHTPPALSFRQHAKHLARHIWPAQFGGAYAWAPARNTHFHEEATSHGRVCWFVRTIIRRIIPLALFGSAHNRSVVLRAAMGLVTARRFERMNLHEALHGFRTRECAWLRERTGQRRTDGAQRAAHAAVCEWVWWVLAELVLPLLRTTFYVTEAGAFRQRVLYFRHDLWQRMTAPHLAQLRDRQFARVAGADRMRRLLPYAQVRLLPKETGVRPIVNLRRRTPAGASANALLQTVFDVLTYEKARQPSRWGASVLGLNDVYVHLLAYKQARPRSTRLYAVKADIRAAFDTIDQTRLLHLVRTLFAPHAAYVVQRYTQIRPGVAGVARDAVRRAHADDQYPVFPARAAGARHAVLVDSVAYPLTDAAHVLRLVEEHVTNNLVRFRDGMYRQTAGVPQGSSLSTLLCSLLLADMERMLLPTVHPADCLLRYVDDFLFLTPSRARAASFCRALHAGSPLHGCEVAREKSLVNFDMVLPDGALVPRVPPGEPVPWCGVRLDTHDLSVHPDPARYPAHIGDTLTVTRGMRPGLVLAHRLLRAVRARTHILYTDATLNSPCGAYSNLLEGFVVAAAKLHAYCCSLRHQVRPRFLLHAITHAVELAHPMVAARARMARAALHPAACTAVHRDCVEWLGWFAFHAVLARRRAHAVLVHSLELQMRAHRFRRARVVVGHLALTRWPQHARVVGGW